MGATLPAMERVVGHIRRDGHSIALLYASNTLGAVLGVLAAAFWLVPALGLVHTTLLCQRSMQLVRRWPGACVTTGRPKMMPYAVVNLWVQRHRGDSPAD